MRSGIMRRRRGYRLLAIFGGVAMLLLPASLSAARGPAERPLFRSDAFPEAECLAILKQHAGASDEQLRALVLDPGARSPGIAAVQRLVAIRDRQPDAARLLDRMLAVALADTDLLPEAEVAGAIDEAGARNPANGRLKLQAYYYALRGFLRRDEADARRAICILERFAEVVPRWPLTDPEGNAHPQGETAYYSRWDARGLWGVWFYQDLWACQPLLWAWDLAGASEAMRRPGVSRRIEGKLLRFLVEFQFRYPPTYGNLENYILDGLISFGLLLPEPEYIHRAVQWHRAVILTQFYADGLWHEGTPAYHKDIWLGMARSIPALLKGYSDPPGFTSKVDGSRFDGLDLAARYAPQFRRMEAALNHLVLPDGTVAGIHDAFPPDYHAWWTRPLGKAHPALLGSSGNGILGMGEGANQTLALLHFGGMHGHEHLDTLNLLYWTMGHEAYSETMYRPLPGDISTQEWHVATAAHNTVVIDERNQAGRFENERRQLTPEDAVAGIPDGRYRAYGHGDSLSDGKLLLFEPTLAGLQFIEADGRRGYVPRPDLYRRTLALVDAGGSGAYLLDVFRVRGGSVHDWMLHGCLQKAYSVRVDRPLRPRDGTLHRHLKQLQSCALEADLSVDFVLDEPGAPQTRVWLMGQAGAELVCGMAPAMRRKGPAQFLDVRHPGPESLFAAVHHAHAAGRPAIRSVEFARLPDLGVAARVTLADGRTDLLVSTLDEAGGPVREVKEWGISLKGRLAFARLSDGKPERLVLVRGESFTVGGRTVSGAVPFAGEILGTTRTEDGAESDTLSASAALPAGDGLKGRALLLDLGGVLTQSITVDRVEADGNGWRILTTDDPGITIQGELVKLQHFPCWGLPGPCRFLVENPRELVP